MRPSRARCASLTRPSPWVRHTKCVTPTDRGPGALALNLGVEHALLVLRDDLDAALERIPCRRQRSPSARVRAGPERRDHVPGEALGDLVTHARDEPARVPGSAGEPCLMDATGIARYVLRSSGLRAVKIRTPLHLLAAALVYPLAWIAKQIDAIRKIGGGE